MGIRGLYTLIEKYVGYSIKDYEISHFKNSIIAIDSSILLYKFRYASQQPNAHIYGFLKRVMLYLKNGIYPVFVFDGKPPPEKMKTLEKRSRKKEKIEKRIRVLEQNLTLENKLQVQKLSKQLVRVKTEDHLDIKELLQCLGLKFIVSEHEAETVCAQLQSINLVDYTYSEDTDLFPLGCERILRNHKRNQFSLIYLQTILKGLQLNFKEFVDMCILCGCDYCPSIPKVNQYKSYELIRKYHTIEKVLEHLKQENYIIPKNFDYQSARDIFLQSQNCDNINLNVVLKQPQINETQLRHFLQRKQINKSFVYNYIRNFKRITS